MIKVAVILPAEIEDGGAFLADVRALEAAVQSVRQLPAINIC